MLFAFQLQLEFCLAVVFYFLIFVFYFFKDCAYYYYVLIFTSTHSRHFLLFNFCFFIYAAMRLIFASNVSTIIVAYLSCFMSSRFHSW
jgi:hypothetical protein